MRLNAISCALQLLLFPGLRLLLVADSAHSRGRLPRTEDRLVCGNVDMVSQVLGLHLRFLVAKRQDVSRHGGLVGAHM